MRKLGRVVRAIVLNLVAVVGALVLLVVVLFGLAQTSAGERLMRRQAVSAVNRSIEGSVAVEGLGFSGNRIVLEGVTIWTPEHERVGTIRRVALTLRPWALVRRTVHIERFAIEQPDLALERQPAGLNLSRALKARRPQPPPKKPLGVRIALDELALDGGRVDYRGAPGARPAHARVVDLTMRARGFVDARARRGDGALEIRGAAKAPVAAPLQVSAAGHLIGRDGGGSLSASAGRSVLDAHASAEGDTLRARLDRMEVTPELVRVFVPGYTSPTPLSATAVVSSVGQRVDGNASLKAGPGSLELEGQADRRQPAFSVKAKGRNLDLASLIPDRPRSDIDLDLDAAGSGRSWAELDGHIDLEVPAARVGDQTLGPLRVHARAEREGARWLEALARLPGLTAGARGSGDVNAVAGRGDVTVVDAGRLARALEVVLGRPLPPAAGTLAVRFAADGRPGDLGDARLHAASPSLTVGTTRLTGLSLRAESDGQALRSRLQVGGPLAVLATLAGQWSDGHRALDLTQMRVSYPQATWSLAGPARLAFAGGKLEVQDFRLRAAPDQEIAIDARKDGRAIAGDFAVSALRLHSLPSTQGRPPMAGVLDARVRASGTTDDPRADATVELRRGRIGAYSGVNATVVARVAGRRATGTFKGRAAQGWARGSFAVPASWPPAADAPIRVDATARLPDLTRVPALAARRPGLEGDVRMRLAVRGTAASPRADVTVDAERLAAVVPDGTAAPPEVNLRLRAGYAGAATTLRLQGRSSNGGELSARAWVKARVSLVRPAGVGPAIRRAPVSARLVANDFALSPLAAVSDRVAAVGGRLGGEVRVSGTVAKPAVQGRMSWRNGRVIVRRPEAQESAEKR